MPDDFVSSVVDAAPDGMLVVDAEGIIVFANRQAAELFGVEHDELIGSPVDSRIPSRHRAEHHRHRIEYRAEPTVRPMGVGMLLRALRADGTEFPVEVSLSPLPGASTFHVVAAVRDVTARVEIEERAEEQLRRSREAMLEADRVMAIADDRERIARDLHDTVIQRLFASGLALQAAASRAEPDVAPRLEGIVDDLDATIREIRTVIFSLQATGSADEGTRVRVLDLIGEAAQNLGFEPRLLLDGPIETVDEEIVAQLLPSLREALTNVAKHAGASVVDVALTVDDSEVRLVVRDDGAGLGPDRGTGRGLDNMATRAEVVGGSFRIEAGDDRGTCVEWSAPFAVGATAE
ncbi:MAG TPA: PAS domain-containing sensor histidine kinase [Acidimicrobiales bacterium]